MYSCCLNLVVWGCFNLSTKTTISSSIAGTTTKYPDATFQEMGGWSPPAPLTEHSSCGATPISDAILPLFHYTHLNSFVNLFCTVKKGGLNLGLTMWRVEIVSPLLPTFLGHYILTWRCFYILTLKTRKPETGIHTQQDLLDATLSIG